MRGFSTKTLKWQLVSRFALVLTTMLVIANVGFLLFLLTILSPTNSPDLAVRSPIEAAIRVRDGVLSIEDTDALRQVREKYPNLWLVVQRSDGRRAVLGDVPTLFDSVLAQVDRVRSLDLRGEDGSVETAALIEVSNELGEFKVLYGGNPTPGSWLLNLMWGLRILYIPFTVVPLIGVFLVLPYLVGRALRGLKRTTATASSISADSLGVRLSTNDVIEELHPLVQAINGALSRIDDDVSRRQRFFANAAHELRTPIAILQTRLDGLSPSVHRDRLLLDVARLAAMAEQLLDMQRLETVRTLDTVDLVSIAEIVAADCGPLAIAAGYDFEFEAEISSLMIKGDQSSLERAVTNLIRNAIEHGGGSGTIRVLVSGNGWVEVSDEGPGVSKDEQERVFEPFYRTIPKSTGAGLGLSIVDQIARAHRGYVRIIEQNRGATFRLKIG